MSTTITLTRCRYCVVSDGHHEPQCVIALRNCTEEEVPLENQYRKGVHQAYGMLDQWLEKHPAASARDVVHIMRIMSRAARSDRGPRPGLIDDLFARLEAGMKVDA